MHHLQASSVLLIAGLAIAQIVVSLGSRTCADDQPDVVECRQQALAEAVPLLANGIPEIGAAPIEPLDQLPALTWHTSSRGHDYTIRLENPRISGLGHSVIDKLQVDSSNHNIHVVSHIDGVVAVEGAYNMAGHVLGVPLEGTGLLKAVINGATVDATFSGHLETGVGGASYLKLDSVHVALTLGERQYEISGLFGDYQPLVQAGNLFINTIAANLLHPEMQPTLEKWLAEVFKQRAQAVFSSVPYEQLFPKTSAYTGF